MSKHITRLDSFVSGGGTMPRSSTSTLDVSFYCSQRTLVSLVRMFRPGVSGTFLLAAANRTDTDSVCRETHSFPQKCWNRLPLSIDIPASEGGSGPART